MKRLSLFTGIMMTASMIQADETIIVPVQMVSEEGIGHSIGSVTIRESEHGLVFEPELEGLPEGKRGFHVHSNPDCGPGDSAGAAMAAGGHLDPENNDEHGFPWGEGHLGDLPALYVDSDGKANYPVLAPRLSLEDVRGRSLMLHEGGDNHSDHPESLGGGGPRIACGVIKK